MTSKTKVTPAQPEWTEESFATIFAEEMSRLTQEANLSSALPNIVMNSVTLKVTGSKPATFTFTPEPEDTRITPDLTLADMTAEQRATRSARRLVEARKQAYSYLFGNRTVYGEGRLFSVLEALGFPTPDAVTTISALVYDQYGDAHQLNFTVQAKLTMEQVRSAIEGQVFDSFARQVILAAFPTAQIAPPKVENLKVNVDLAWKPVSEVK
jgi:hypothetical protein